MDIIYSNLDAKPCCCTISNSGQSNVFSCPSGYTEVPNVGDNGEPGCTKSFEISCDAQIVYDDNGFPISGCVETDMNSSFWPQPGVINPGAC